MDSSMFDEPNSAMKRLKRNMTLDFGSPSIKKLKSKDLATPIGALLQSPDLQMLKLASPELEKMIIQANGLVTTTPTPTSILFPKYVTHEQELYARGFVDALAQLKSVEVTHFNNVEPKQPTSQAAKAVDQAYPPNSVMSTLSEATLQHLTTITTAYSNGVVLPSRASLSVSSSGLDSKPRNLTNNHISNPLVDIRLPKLEEEPQTVPCLGSSPPLSPINMESQERIKLERKRARNRVAARKCRTRKLERISRLEDRVKDLKGQNSDLLTTATSLREQVMKLKQQIVEHCQSGCQIAMPVNGTAL